MHEGAVLAHIQQLKKDLEEIEKRVEAGGLPLPLLEDFKEIVDNVRTTLWAAISSQSHPDTIGPAIANLRVRRASSLCERIILDVDANEIDITSPELLPFKGTLIATIERLDRLYASGM